MQHEKETSLIVLIGSHASEKDYNKHLLRKEDIYKGSNDQLFLQHKHKDERKMTDGDITNKPMFLSILFACRALFPLNTTSLQELFSVNSENGTKSVQT